MAHLYTDVPVQFSVNQRLVYISLDQHDHVIYFKDPHLNQVNGLID
jgi:hypothetical protein